MICDFFQISPWGEETAGLTYCGAHFTSLCLTVQRPIEKKGLAVRGLFYSSVADDQAKTISSFSTVPFMLAPGINRPERINCATGFSIRSEKRREGNEVGHRGGRGS